jgi:hypothetical protein
MKHYLSSDSQIAEDLISDQTSSMLLDGSLCIFSHAIKDKEEK